MNQNSLPILEAIQKFNNRKKAYFCVPGHRGDKGIDEELKAAFGSEVFNYDLTEADGLDDFHDASGAIKEAFALSKELFGTTDTWFSVNGTTSCITAMIMAVAGCGEKVILARNCHKSVINALVFSGAEPVWVNPEFDPEFSFAAKISVHDIKKAIENNKDAKAVMIVSPTYYGDVSDIKEVADICHENNMALLVDEAHGSHLFFADHDMSAIKLGADLVSVSVHKTAGAMTQCSMLHFIDHNVGIDSEKVEACLKMMISTSPSYVLMSSIDAARHRLFCEGGQAVNKAFELGIFLREEAEKIEGLKVYKGSDLSKLLKEGIDPSRVVINTAGLSISAAKFKERLFDKFGVSIEMADAFNLVFVITDANTKEEIEYTVSALEAVARECKKDKKEAFSLPDKLPKAEFTPRECFYKKSGWLDVSMAKGRICAEAVTPYPPGIALVVPGEVIDEDVIAKIRYCDETGVEIHGFENGCIKVIME